MSFNRKAWLFLLFALAILLIWVYLGPTFREANVWLMDKVGLKTVAIYVDTA